MFSLQGKANSLGEIHGSRKEKTQKKEVVARERAGVQVCV